LTFFVHRHVYHKINSTTHIPLLPPPCVGPDSDSNGIQIIQTTAKPIVEGGTSGFISIDPIETNKDCEGVFPDDNSGVFLIKSELGTPASNTYYLWFRDLNNPIPLPSETIKIKIDAPGGTKYSGGISTITVKNADVTFASSILTTTIEVRVN